MKGHIGASRELILLGPRKLVDVYAMFGRYWDASRFLVEADSLRRNLQDDGFACWVSETVSRKLSESIVSLVQTSY